MNILIPCVVYRQAEYRPKLVNTIPGNVACTVKHCVGRTLNCPYSHSQCGMNSTLSRNCDPHAAIKDPTRMSVQYHLNIVCTQHMALNCDRIMCKTQDIGHVIVISV